MSEVYFTADTHFNHVSMVTKGWRPQFPSVPAMNEAMVENWNARVTKRDTVWHLGDFGMGPDAEHLAILRRLRGTIHLVTGNHDAVWPGFRDAHAHQRRWLAAGFESVQSFARRRIGNREVWLSHFPYEGDRTARINPDRFDPYRPHSVGNQWLLHGHVHGEWAERGRQINVGVDVRGFEPVHTDDITKIIEGLEG